MTRIRFTRRNFTIPEGHYTGPKQKQEKTAAQQANTFGLSGALFGGLKGYFDGDPENTRLGNVIRDAVSGYTWGALSGLALKGIDHYINKPLDEIQFEKVDQAIRLKFGQFRIPIVDVGVGFNNKTRGKINNRIRYNDRNITNYKINFGIKRSQITMYTFGLTDDELSRVSQILDDYIYQNPNTKYHSDLINKSQNSYAVYIVFTTYASIAGFITDVAEELETIVNVLDKDIYVSSRLNEFNVDRSTGDRQEGSDTEIANSNNNVVKVISNGNPALDDLKKNSNQRQFSFISKGKNAAKSALDFLRVHNCNFSTFLKLVKQNVKLGSVSNGVADILIDLIKRQEEKQKAVLELPTFRKNFGVDFLIQTLKNLHYTEGYHFTVGDKKNNYNISCVGGIFLLTVNKGKESEDIDKAFYDSDRANIGRAELDKVVTYTHIIDSREKFEFLLKKLFSTKITFNVVKK